MDTNWQLARNFVEAADGQRRWDYVYQYLLQWAMEQCADLPSAPSQSQEERHEHRHLCTCLDSTSTTSADH